MEILKKHIEKVKQIQQNYNEVEIRLGSFTDTKSPRFTSDTSKQAFDRVFTFVKNHASFVREKSDLITLLPNNKRVIQENEKITYEKKNKIAHFDEPEYSLRLAVSSEENISKEDCDISKIDMVKARKRYIFVYGTIVIFFTIYTIKDISKELKFNIEIEFDCKEVTQKDLDFMENILKAYHDTSIIIPYSFKKEIIEYLCSIFKLKKYKNIFNQPTPININKIHFDEEYGVSLKLDGLRRALLIYKGYIISFNPSKGNEYVLSVLQKTSKGNTYLFDTELYNNVHYVFDTLIYEGKDVTSMSLRERISLYEGCNVIKKVKNIKTKKHFLGKNLYKLSINILNFKDNKNISDGLIYTSSKGYFEPVLKYKYQTTIDFIIRKEADKVSLLVKDKDNMVIFRPEKLFNKENQFKDIPDKTIVECFYDIQKQDFYPLKIRGDKLSPNFIDIANDNFDNIVNPFDLRYFINKYPLQNSPFLTFANERFFHYSLRKVLSTKNIKHLSCLLYQPYYVSDVYKLIDFGYRNIYIDTSNNIELVKENIQQNDMSKTVYIDKYKNGNQEINTVLSYKNFYDTAEYNTLIVLGFHDSFKTINKGGLSLTRLENKIQVNDSGLFFDIIEVEKYKALKVKLLKTEPFINFYEHWKTYCNSNILSEEGQTLYSNLHVFVFKK